MRGLKSIQHVLAEVMARRGYAGVQRSAIYEDVWRQAVGEFAARHSRVGSMRRGTLEVLVANSALVQELVFQKPDLLITLAQLLPEAKINDLRFRVGQID